ncbi:unnamed protein product, partial [Tilletia caries]
GTAGYAGCRVCPIKAVYPDDNQALGYFPLSTVGRQLVRRNDDRDDVDPFTLPNRDDTSYARALHDLSAARNAHERTKVQKETGVCGLPLIAASPAFSHPYFFPSDMFHLFGLNLPPLLYDVFTSRVDGDPFSFTRQQEEQFGLYVETNGANLPPSFCDVPPRNPAKHAKRYKAHEWHTTTYVFLLPFLFSIGAPVEVVAMVSDLVMGVRIFTAGEGCTFAQLQRGRNHFHQFTKRWESLYVRGDLQLLHRATISQHYLHHIGDTAAQLGSIRVASQARCEREIGYIKRSVRSTKAPIPNIVNNVLRTECLRLLDVLVGEEESEEKKLRGVLKVKIGAQHRKLTDYEDHQQSRLLVMAQEAGHFPTPLPRLVFRGRLVLNDGTVLRGDRIEQKATRRGSRFLLRTEKNITYHEVIHFMTYSDDGNALDDKATIGLDLVLALIWTICDVTKASGIIRGRWSSQLDMIQFGPDDMVEPVAIVELDNYAYILRSHTWTGID